MTLLQHFDEIWLIDFEFRAPSGARPFPLCLVAIELRSGRHLEFWDAKLRDLKEPPFDVGPRSLVVAYYASAEMSCFLALGWSMPVNLLDLYCEFRQMTNGLSTPSGWGLLGALVAFGLDALGATEKESNRQLVMRGGPYTDEERVRILKYCGSDVEALVKLIKTMESRLTEHALLRGRYMQAAAKMEWTGVPLDTTTLTVITERWESIQDELIRRVDSNYGIYEGRTFKAQAFAKWLHEHGIHWPMLESGNLALDDDTFREMAKAHPEIAPLRELRVSLSQMHLSDLAVGADRRNRTLLSAFGSRSSRNQPSNSRFIFGPATWLRGLIRPEMEMALAYVDYSQQEFGIAAALSGDKAMQAAYLSGDPYLGFAKVAGAVPKDATKKTHSKQRELFKTIVLGVQYCMSEIGLAARLAISTAEARHLLNLHRIAFPVFWRWSDAVVDYAMLNGSIYTVFNWQLHVTADTRPRSLRNFPMQAHGAEILRLACCLATERGIRVCAPVHDALLVEGPTESIDDIVMQTQKVMREAGEIILNGFPLNSDAKIIRYPDRYMDPRGETMWKTVNELINGEPQGCDGSTRNPAHPV